MSDPEFTRLLQAIMSEMLTSAMQPYPKNSQVASYLRSVTRTKAELADTTVEDEWATIVPYQ